MIDLIYLRVKEYKANVEENLNSFPQFLSFISLHIYWTFWILLSEITLGRQQNVILYV